MRTPRLRSGMPPGVVIGTPRSAGRGLRAPTLISQDMVAGGVVGATPGAGGSSGAGIPPVGSNGSVLAVVTGAATWTFTTLITGLGTIATGVWQGTKIALGFGGTGSDLTGTGGAHKFLRQNSVGANVDVVQPDFSDLASTLSTHLIAGSNVTLTGTDPVTLNASAASADWDGPFIGAWGDGGWGEGGWGDLWYNIQAPPTRGSLLAADGAFPSLAPYWTLDPAISSITLAIKTFATLPSPATQGQLATISDSTTAVWGATVAGGGANKTLVWYNGTNWTVIGA